MLHTAVFDKPRTGPTTLVHTMGLPYSKHLVNRQAAIPGNSRYRTHASDNINVMKNPENEKNLVPQNENPGTQFFRHHLGLARNMLVNNVEGIKNPDMR